MPARNVAAAQYRARPGVLRVSISRHLDFIHHAAAEQIDLLVFPELSLTDYGRAQAVSLAFPFTNDRLFPLQEAAVTHRISIVAGMPLRLEQEVAIGFVDFLSGGSRVATLAPAGIALGNWW